MEGSSEAPHTDVNVGDTGSAQIMAQAHACQVYMRTPWPSHPILTYKKKRPFQITEG